MKKLLGTIAIIALSFAQQANAQIKQGPYASFNIGYNFANNAGTAYQYGELFDFYNGTSTTTSDSFELVKLSLGKGLNFSGQFGYMFNKNVGAEIGVGYLIGSETTATNSDINSFNSNTSTNTLKANQIQIKPTLVIAAGFEKINPYAKIGLVMGMSKTMYTNNEIDTNSFGTDITYMEAEMTGGLMLGFRASAGLNYALNDKISLFAELTSINGKIKPTKGEITTYTENGVNVLPDFTYNDSHFEFIDEGTFTGPEPDSVAQKALRPNFSASSLGLNFGVAFHF
ncbi:outer membrane beta-barrel protein [Flavobacterium sp.]|uniref:outer membrane beta-barrel protein n=1 Tax=Flavobacterium sp. TaxID=239 RepID=UPI00374CA0C8